MTFGFVCYIIPFVAHWDIAKLVRHRILIPTFRRFESCYPSHVGTSFACSDFLFHKKSVTRSAVPPFPKKCSLGSPIRLQARSFTAHSRYHLFSGCSTSANVNLVGFVVFGQALLVPIFYFIKNQSPAPLSLLFRKNARSVRLFACKRAHLRLAVANTFFRGVLHRQI